ncbi:hypothetical protein GGX14DRAFT_396820 [Mycena pura]|uniref:Uncharacterized protein n=1 Tax=Mycena pura TaxID=153505 RepID=A0AAD6V9Q6_9AGAR|nr:hypothetical protein GGX14DRAFT_396820 [Mycena pura]
MTYSTKGVDLGGLDMPPVVHPHEKNLNKSARKHFAGQRPKDKSKEVSSRNMLGGGFNPDQSDTTTPSKRYSEVGGVARPAAAEPQRRRPPVALIMAARSFAPVVSINGTVYTLCR